MFRYEADEAVVEQQQQEYEGLSIPHSPFSLSDGQLIELGRRYVNCLSTQDYETRLHDYPIDETNNKPWKYLKGIPKGSKVLFLGAGVGRELLCAEAMGLDAYGVTMGSQNVNFGRLVLGLKESRFIEGCIELLPFESEMFDVVAGFQVFEHYISPLLCLLEQRRVLKTGCELVLEWPAASAHATNGADPQHQVCYTPGQAEGLLLKAGFDNIRLYYVDMSVVPKDSYWKGEQNKGYLVAKATKVTSQEKYINT